MPEIIEPIFVVGTGRCGSTIFHRLLAEHHRLAFLTSMIDRRPSNFIFHRVLLNLWDRPGHVFRRRIQPSEAWHFWNFYVKGFSQPFRDLQADDATIETKQVIHSVFPRLLTKKRRRLLIKLTGWTRVSFIKEVFPDAKILHIIRDPRAIAVSLLEVDWWKGWQGPEQWRWGPLTDAEDNTWRKYGQSFLVLAAIQWIKIMKAYRRSLAGLSESLRNDILEIRYERLCESKEDVMNDVLLFSGLEPSSDYQRVVTSYTLESRDHKWKQYLTARQQRELNQALEELDWEKYVSRLENVRSSG